MCDLSQEDHREKHGVGLHVHHITPRVEYIDESGDLNYEAANELDNLLTVCTNHHGTVEGMSRDELMEILTNPINPQK